MDEWMRSDFHNKMPAPVLHENGDAVDLTTIATFREHQGKGYACRALKLLTDLADQRSMVIHLHAFKLPDQLTGCPASLNDAELIEWYRRNYFVEVEPGSFPVAMTRQPRSIASREGRA